MRQSRKVFRLSAVGLGVAMALSSVTVATATTNSSHHGNAKKPTHKKSKPKKPKTTTTTTASTVNFNSCSDVTQAQAASAIGASVTPGVLGNATVEGGLACVFYGSLSPTPHTPNAAQPDSVRVVIVKGADAVTWYNSYKSLTGARAQPISGYGDKAFYDGDASLSVLKGSYYLRVAVVPAGAPPSLASEEKLAAAILPKL